MNTTLWAVIGGAIFTVLVALGGYRAGAAVTDLENKSAQLIQADKVIQHQQIVIREVPKIITKFVQTTTTVEKTYHDSIEVVPDLFDPSCVMPRWWGELFANAANGVSSDPRRSGKPAGVYGCAETATATLKDLSAGGKNTARLQGVHEWAVLEKGK